MKLTNLLKYSFLLVLGTACVDVEGPKRETLSPSDVLAQVRIRSEAIMIAKGDSHQIEFDIIAMNGESIPFDHSRIKWTTTEAQTVSTSQNGTLYGKEITTTPIKVIVQYEHKYITKLDTVNVYVTDGRIDANKIRLVSIDSNRIGANPLGGHPRVRVDLYKNDSIVEKGSFIPIQADAPVVATMDPAGGPGGEPVYRISNDRLRIGKFWVRASLNLYGNEISDSLSFTGLYGALPTPISGVSDLPEDYNGPIPLLDTIPLRLFQLCTVQIFVNFSSAPVDFVFSDSTASSTGCASDPASITFLSTFLPWPAYGEFIGGNVLNMPPLTTAIRKSRTAGVVSFTVRNSLTKETLPWFTGRIQQTDVPD